MVWLNGRAYPILGPVHMQRVDVTPFAGKISAGDPKYGDFTVSSQLVYRDLRAGLGIFNARQDKPGRYWESALDTRYPYQMVLHPLAVNSASTWSFNPGPSVSEIAGVIVATGNEAADSIRYFDTSWHAGTGLSGGQNYGNLVRYTVPGGSLTLFALARGGGTRYAYSTNGTAWTPVNLAAGDASGKTLTDACLYDAKLVAVSSDGNVFVSTTPTTASPTGYPANSYGWGLATINGPVPDTPTRIVCFLDRQGAPAVFVIGTQGVWAVDIYAGEVSQVLDLAGSKHANNGIGACVHGGALHIPTSRGVLRFDNTGVAANIGPVAPGEDGFPGPGQGSAGASYNGAMVTMLQSDGPTLYALYGSAMGNSASAGAAALLAYDQMGWHVLHIVRTSALAFEARNDVSSFYKSPTTATTGNARIWIGTYHSNSAVSYAVNYIEIPLGTENPLLVNTGTNAYRYETDGMLVTSWDDGGFSEISKGAYELLVNYKLGNVANVITVEYQLDGDLSTGTWLMLANITGDVSPQLQGSQTFRFPAGGGGQGLSFKTIRFRVSLYRTSTATTTPVVNYLTLKFVPRPATKYSFSFVVDLSPEALIDAGLDFPTARAALDACRDSVTLLDFYEFDPALGAPRWQVLLANKQEMTSFADSLRRGRLTINLTEVI